MQNALIKTTPQSLQKLSRALAITEKLLEDDNPLGLPELIPYRKGDKWGFCNRKKEIVIACEYSEVEPFKEGLAKVIEVDEDGFIETTYGDENGYDTGDEDDNVLTQRYKYALIDKKGNKVTPFYNEIEVFSGGFARVGIKIDDEYNFKYGFIDKYGNEIVPLIYDFIFFDFFEGLVAVKKNGKYGFIDTVGNMVIPIIYEGLHFLREGLARVEKNGKYGIIDRQGCEIISFIYDFISFDFSDGLAGVRKNGKYGFVDKQGNEVVPLIYDDIVNYSGSTHFSDGLAVVKKNGKYGFIDKKGNEIIPFVYDWSTGFFEGLASVKKQDKYGFIDKKGREVIPFIYDHASPFLNGLSSCKKKYKSGCIDKQGNEIIPILYDSVSDFSEGLSRVAIKVRHEYIYGDVFCNSKYGFIDNQSNEVIPLIYDSVSDFSEGVACVEKNGKIGFINKEGNVVIPFIYEYYGDSFFTVLTSGLARVRKKGISLYIDKNGVEYYEEEPIKKSNEILSVTDFMMSSGNTQLVKFVKVNQNGYLHITFLNARNDILNIYFSKNAAELVTKGQIIEKGFFNLFRIAKITNMNGEENIMLIGLTENYSFDKEGGEYYKEQQPSDDLPF